MKLMQNQYASHTDYADFVGVIGGNPNFVPSNVDGICERKGKFLVMEWKRPKERVSKGQEILLKAMAKMSNFIVVIIYGDTDFDTQIDKFYLVNQNGSCSHIGNGFESFKAYYQQWYEWADND